MLVLDLADSVLVSSAPVLASLAEASEPALAWELVLGMAVGNDHYRPTSSRFSFRHFS